MRLPSWLDNFAWSSAKSSHIEIIRFRATISSSFQIVLCDYDIRFPNLAFGRILPRGQPHVIFFCISTGDNLRLSQKLDNLNWCKTTIKLIQKGPFLWKKSYDSKFKSRVAIEALRAELTVAEIAGKYQIHLNLVQQWKKQLQGLRHMVSIFSCERPAPTSSAYH